MFIGKYQYSINRGLFPNRKQNKQHSFLTSYGLLADEGPRQYEFFWSPKNKNNIIMFNKRQYLHRHCSVICKTQKVNQIIQTVTQLYPKQNQTLAIFCVNQPKQCEEILFENKQSLFVMAYRKLIAHKCRKNIIIFSAIGIQTENCLTDSLSLDISLPPQKFSKGSQEQSQAYNLTKVQVKSQEHLLILIKFYSNCKKIKKQGKLQQQQPGELFHFAEVQFDNHHSSKIRYVKSHYILRINQNLKSSNEIMSKLNMNLRRLSTNTKNFDNGDSKLFKILNNCFIKQIQFGIHIFMQIGHYLTIEKEFLNLVSISQAKINLPKKIASYNFYQIPLLYLEDYNDKPSILKLLAATKINQICKTKQICIINSSTKPQMRRSFTDWTISSLQKRMDLQNEQFFQKGNIQKAGRYAHRLINNFKNQKLKQDIQLHKNDIRIKRPSTANQNGNVVDYQLNRTILKNNYQKYKVYLTKNKTVDDKFNYFNINISNRPCSSLSHKNRKIDNEFTSIGRHSLNKLQNIVISQFPEQTSRSQIQQEIAKSEIFSKSFNQQFIDQQIANEEEI